VADERTGRHGARGGGDLAVGDGKEHHVGARARRAMSERAVDPEAATSKLGNERAAEPAPADKPEAQPV